MKSVLANQNSNEQFSTYVNLAIEHVDKDNSATLNYIQHAADLAYDLGDTALIVKAGRMKGQVLRRLGRLEEAKQEFLHFIPIAKRNKLTKDYIIMLHSLAIAFTDMANYDKALEYHFQSLLIRESEGNKEDIAISLENIGRVYSTMNDYEKALEYFMRSLKLKEEISRPYGLEHTLQYIGDCYNHLGMYNKAQEYIHRSLKICGSNCTIEILSAGEYALGLSHFNQENFEEAKQHFLKSYEIAKKSNDKRYLGNNLLKLGVIAVQEGDYQRALIYLTEGEQISESAGMNNLLIDIYKKMSQLYKLQNNYQQASYYQDKYIHLKDSILSESLIKNLAAVQTKFEERENIKTIASREFELSQQRQLIIAVVIIAVLASLLVFMLFKSNKAKRKANDRLDQEVKAATKDLEVANKLLAKVNQELDHFIYKTSHDIRGPLASLKGLCNVAITDVTDPLAIDYLNKLDFTATRLDTLLGRLQKINQINHAELKIEPIDFNMLLDDLEVLEKRKGIPENFTIRRELQSGITFSSDKGFIYLILENLLDNAIKFYNNASGVNPFVLISIHVADQGLVISVIDNGIGIGQANPEELFQLFVRASERSISGGIGLYMSRRATEKLGGEIHMRTTSEGYTEFYVTLPLALP